MQTHASKQSYVQHINFCYHWRMPHVMCHVSHVTSQVYFSLFFLWLGFVFLSAPDIIKVEFLLLLYIKVWPFKAFASSWETISQLNTDHIKVHNLIWNKGGITGLSLGLQVLWRRKWKVGLGSWSSSPSSSFKNNFTAQPYSPPPLPPSTRLHSWVVPPKQVLVFSSSLALTLLLPFSSPPPGRWLS